jgi:hypothetical protein
MDLPLQKTLPPPPQLLPQGSIFVQNWPSPNHFGPPAPS